MWNSVFIDWFSHLRKIASPVCFWPLLYIYRDDNHGVRGVGQNITDNENERGVRQNITDNEGGQPNQRKNLCWPKILS